MCYFITIGVPESRAGALVDAVPRRGFQLARVENKSVLPLLPAGFTTFVLTAGGMCSCDLYRRRQSSTVPDVDELRMKYGKRNWSPAEIERAMSQSLTHQKSPESFVGLRPDVISIVSAVVEKTKRAAVLVHFYDGDVQSEKLMLRRQAMTIESLKANHWIDEDVLAIIEAK